MATPQAPILDADALADLIIQHAKRGEYFAIYSLIKARDAIWAENANAALDEQRSALTSPQEKTD